VVVNGSPHKQAKEYRRALAVMNQIGRSTTDCIDVEEVEKYFFTLFIGDVYGVTRQTPFAIENGGMRLSDCLTRAA
jgi:hypothetical protein